MRIWLVNIGEPLPIDNNGQDRLLRTGILVKYLLDAGHEVVWWTSDFYHQVKADRFGEDHSVKLDNGLQIHLLHGIPYYKNISMRRIINHIQLGKKFKAAIAKAEEPDLIFASFPSIELCVESVRYGLGHKVPVVVDVRDLWPDVFLDAAPKLLRPFAKLLCAPLFRSTQFIFKYATSITGNTDEFVDWGVQYGNRKVSADDKSFPFGYPNDKPDSKQLLDAEKKWSLYNIHQDSNKFIVCYYGTLGEQFDLVPVFDAAKRLENKNALFVMCGEGERLNQYRKEAENYSNIIFPGWIGRPEIYVLSRMSKAGLAPYIEHKNFTDNLTNKPIEYLSASLPILSSINGVLGRLIKKHQCGYVYGDVSGKTLVDCLVELMDYSDKQISMATNAKRLFDEEYSAEVVYSAMVKYFEKTVSAYNGEKINIDD